MIALLLAATPYQTVPTAPVIGDVALGNLLRRYTSRVPHPALYAAVIRGRSFTVAAAGIANVPEPRPAAVTDRLRLGNGSSHFTFLLILRLAAAGILDLRHTPHHYFPETDPEASPYRRVTLAKLMPLAIASGDASGPMPDPREGEPPEEYAVRARAFATAAWLNGAKSKNRPNNQAYIILAAIAERVTRKPLGQLLQDYVFAPLNLDGAEFKAPGPRQPYARHFHSTARDRFVSPLPEHDHYPLTNAYSGVSADIVTIGRYVQHLSNFASGRHNFLPPEYAQYITTLRGNPDRGFPLFSSSVANGIVSEPLFFTSALLYRRATANALYVRFSPQASRGIALWSDEFRVLYIHADEILPELAPPFSVPYPPANR